MTDTAQPALAADPVAVAAEAFKRAREPEAAPQPRDEAGRFASGEQAPEPEQEIVTEGDVAEAEPEVAVDIDVETDEQAAEEAQPDPVDMPVSWSKEDAELWNVLPPETQAKIAEREGQREAAINSKFQEAANARKAHEAQLAEANANRNAYADAIDTVLSMVRPAKPDPRDFGLGTSEYRRDQYDLAVLQYEHQSSIIDNLAKQREAISAQQREESEATQQARFAEIEAKARPALMEAVPDLSDPNRAGAALQEIVDYAVSQGIPDHVFKDPEVARNVTSAELLMAWKAKEYDRLKAAEKRVAPKAKPRPATPPIRPGVSTPRATHKQVAFQKDMARLAKTGSVEDGAAIFRHMRQGN